MQKILILTIVICLCACLFVACDTHEHVCSFGELTITKQPTCTESGQQERVCSCGEKQTSSISSTGHSYSPVEILPTATEQGYTFYQCVKCEHNYKDEYVDALGFSSGLAYSVNTDGETCTIIGIGTCADTEISIPEEIDGYIVNAIGNNAFSNCTNMTRVIIPDSVTIIGEDSFNECNSLRRVTFGENSQLTTIGEDAFINCTSLISITIPVGVTTIESGAFAACYSLVEVYNYSQLNITKGSNDNGSVAFLAIDVYTTDEPSKISNVDGAIIYTNSDAVTFVKYFGTATDIIIPDTVTIIGNHAFTDCISLISVTIPASTTTIAGHAFAYCRNLTSVTFEEDSQLTTIGFNAFGICINLTDIVIPSNVAIIDVYAFFDCNSLTSITIPSSVISIGACAFAGCSSLSIVTF